MVLIKIVHRHFLIKGFLVSFFILLSMTVLTLLAVKASANNPLKVTALGDSITSLGGFISIYNRYVTTDLKYVNQTNNLGVAGWT